ncbi:MAG TPA: M20/M25/M40 family metallo-hydrolase, partial [Pyrinomonadaceae bacterium]|nr:M20/M25/M40 family metallo-hydrolase [Pyrinomonadaceae bacterium]
MNPHEILEYYKGRQGAIVEAIREIVDIESPSHDAEQCRKVADWVERQAIATHADIVVERITVDDGDHVIIRAFPSEGDHNMLLGHIDTVHPVGTQAQNPTRIEDNLFYGCGIFDMKANVVLMLEALRYFVSTGSSPAAAVTILLSCDEEVGSYSGREIVEREARRAARCFVFEPSADGRVKTGRKGTGMFTLRAHGKPAHAGLEPEKGANAIVEISRQIERIHA